LSTRVLGLGPAEKGRLFQNRRAGTAGQSESAQKAGGGLLIKDDIDASYTTAALGCNLGKKSKNVYKLKLAVRVGEDDEKLMDSGISISKHGGGKVKKNKRGDLASVLHWVGLRQRQGKTAGY